MEVKAGAARSLDSSTRSIMNRRPGCDANSLRGRRGRTGWGSRPCRSTRFEDLASTFADECGIVNNREVEIIVDVLTNPASGFVDRKLAKNLASIQVRELDTEEHIRPVAAYLRELGATREQIRRMMVVHPPVCVYDVEDHLMRRELPKSRVNRVSIETSALRCSCRWLRKFLDVGGGL